jgi:hypothetical protein
LIVPAALTTLFTFLHHLDHAFRQIHIGWPLTDRVNPFTFSLILYPLLLLGIYLTVRGRAWAGYWLGVAAFAFTLVTVVHFRPSPSAETLDQVYGPWNNPILGGIAVAIVFALEFSLVALLVTAVRVRVLSGRW